MLSGFSAHAEYLQCRQGEGLREVDQVGVVASVPWEQLLFLLVHAAA